MPGGKLAAGLAEGTPQILNDGLHMRSCRAGRGQLQEGFELFESLAQALGAQVDVAQKQAELGLRASAKIQRCAAVLLRRRKFVRLIEGPAALKQRRVATWPHRQSPFQVENGFAPIAGKVGQGSQTQARFELHRVERERALESLARRIESPLVQEDEAAEAPGFQKAMSWCRSPAGRPKAWQKCSSHARKTILRAGRFLELGFVHLNVMPHVAELDDEADVRIGLANDEGHLDPIHLAVVFEQDF